MKGFTSALWADRILFEVKGENARRFLALAARAGVSLSRLSCTTGGYTGYAAGADVSRLHKAARQARVKLEIRRRYGPGKVLEHIAVRPGLAAGVAVFFLLQWYLSGFIWAIDFGEMEPGRQMYFRQALAGQNIWEGCRIREEQLRLAEETLELETQDVGWLSLNFTAGCLFVEENERETQQIRQDQEPQALYAKAGGQVLSIRLESGFAEVVAGQYAAPGQLLANGQKADRKGQAVVQGASGSILGRIQKSYTAEQPLQSRTRALTGRARTSETWYVLGQKWEQKRVDPDPADQMTTEWLPLRLGRLALPACLCRVTYWETDEQTETYSEAEAQALAARSCRMALMEEFPDAEVETETLHFETGDDTVVCRADYLFCAEMAQTGPLAPLENTQGTS